MINNQYLALFLTFLAALIWLRVNDFTAQKGWVESQLSRKIIHIGTGPIFVLCWLLFPGNPFDRYLAALVPGLITLQFILVGFGVIKDEAAVEAMSRTGNPREILRGPMFYGIVFVVLTIIYWLDSPIGIIGLMLMCGGDGLADIIGRRFGKRKLPWSPQKTWLGSLGMLMGGLLLAVVVMSVFIASGTFHGSITNFFLPIVIIAAVGTLVESLPIRDIDNVSVTVVAIIVGHLFF
jgi:phytol kinase